MPDFTVPTLDEMHELLIADYQARFPKQSVSRFSDNWKRLRTLALAVTSLHAHVDQVYEDLLPDGAEDDRLDRHGAIYSVTRKPATIAEGTDVLRVTGTPASIVSDGDELTHRSSGVEFKITETVAIHAGGYVDVSVESVTAGSAARLQAGEVLVFNSPPSGVNSEAELQADLEGGDDQEQDGPYRQRILDRIAQPGMGGNAEDYRQWALEVAGIASAYVYSGRNGNGSIDLVVLKSGDGDERIPSSDEIEAVQEYIDAKRPVSVKDFRVLTVEAQEQNIHVLVEPESDEYEFDWNDETPLVVAAWDAGTRTLQFTTDRPADMVVGDRLTVITTATGTGEESIIEAFGADDEVILREAPAATPNASNEVFSGGPLVEPTRQALLDLMNSLGPARGTTAAFGWKGALTTADVFKVTQLMPGVLDSEHVTPSSNVIPTDNPPSPTLNVLVAGRVVVRRRWS